MHLAEIERLIALCQHSLTMAVQHRSFDAGFAACRSFAERRAYLVGFFALLATDKSHSAAST